MTLLVRCQARSVIIFGGSLDTNLLYFRIDAAAVPIRHKDRRIDYDDRAAYLAYLESCGVPLDQIDDAGVVMLNTEDEDLGS